MKNADSKARLKELYLPAAKDFVLVDVPRMRFVCIDGRGAADRSALDQAVKWLFAVIYPVRRIARQRMGRNFVEPPLEGLWWADDVQDFLCGNKARLNWRMMIVYEDLVGLGQVTAGLFTQETFADAVAAAGARLGEPPESLRLATLHEGLSAQIMHLGPPDEQGATLARLHREFLPARGLIPNGHHHEIYLTDPTRVAPQKMKTVLRQPVRRSGQARRGEPAFAAGRCCVKPCSHVRGWISFQRRGRRVWGKVACARVRERGISPRRPEAT